MVHKPKGVVCTNRDPAGRIRAVDLLPPEIGRLFVVGRLDEDSTGLLLMTNDGELAERITHPRYGIPKKYRVEVRGLVSDEDIQRLKRGVHLSDGKASAAAVEIVHRGRQSSVLMITLSEKRSREVRRMLARLSHAVRSLKRVQIGPLELRGLPVGACRRLLSHELEQLRATVAGRPARGRRTRRGTSSREAGSEKPMRGTKKASKRSAERPPEGGGRPRRRVIS